MIELVRADHREDTHDEPRPRIIAVVPAYRARATLRHVVERVLEVVDLVVVVDDACPEQSAEVVRDYDARVTVCVHSKNRGVGGAMKTGITEALRLGADYVIKIDADDQMDPSYVPQMIDVLEGNPEVDLVKGNRFTDAATIRTMPLARLVGNAGLTFLVKFSSGYWSLVDPTNGYLAIRTQALDNVELSKLAERYFFETDLLCLFGLRRRIIAEMEMPAIYGAERSSLSISRALIGFPPRLIARFIRRIFFNYFITEINLGSVCAALGFPLLVIAIVFGGHEWAIALESRVGRPTGTVILALLLFMTGFQLSLQAFLYDVQFSMRTLKVRGRRGAAKPEGIPFP
jgi:glycosyltransferase involved in cell wall biosynthesis